MKIPTFFSGLFLSLLLLTGVNTAHADDQFSREFGDYIVHFNAFNSSVLDPKIAQQYELRRGKNIGLLNIAVQKKAGGLGEGVDAILRGDVRNLLGNKETLAFKRIQEENAIYFIAAFRVSGDDLLRFEINIQPDANHAGYRLQFEKALLTQ